MSARDPEISVVVPVYRESAHLGRLVEEVSAAFAQAGASGEIVVVDDGSPDRTWEVVAELAAGREGHVRGLRLSRNFGKEAALAAGLDVARGAGVVTMDGDLQHPPELIPRMIERWRRGDVEIVEAVKVDRGREGWTHRLGSKLFYWILARFSGFDLRGASDYKLCDRRVVEAWRRLGEKNLFYRGMIAWLGFRRDTIGFEVPERATGVSRWSFVALTRLAVTAVTAFSSIPLRIVTAIGIVFLAFAVVLGAQTLYNKFTGQAVSGFTTVILLQLSIGSLLMISLGIIGEYISKLYREVKGRPRYLVLEETGDDTGISATSPGSAGSDRRPLDR